MNFDRKLRTPKCKIFMCIYRKSECESERQKFDPNGPKIIDFELLFGTIFTSMNPKLHYMGSRVEVAMKKATASCG